MRSYIQFKESFTYESYLDISNIEHRKPVTRLRISVHNLPIERLRYTRPPTSADARFCPHCPTKIGNKVHFLIECTKHKDQRNTTFKNIIDLFANFRDMSDTHKFIFFLTTEGSILSMVAKFISQCMP